MAVHEQIEPENVEDTVLVEDMKEHILPIEEGGDPVEEHIQSPGTVPKDGQDLKESQMTWNTWELCESLMNDFASFRMMQEQPW
ncbi:hypothetical protein BDN71DRAFT_1507684 [Pleurotus eryngii]|uniref:Uncharacterized protein n=1 Tax=Pleurotus eryngii TaxID=5323 RepID=A0A9P6D6A1_PLEER|nr:hypothetical protein BDN71DRAFT_1507684 [Pleurotus eryngii]